MLQFKNRLYESQKLTLYLYINIEVFLGYGNSLERTATLQQVQHMETKLWEIGGNKTGAKKLIIISHNFFHKKRVNIREPQWKIRTFALSNWETEIARQAGKNIALAKQENFPRQAAKRSPIDIKK